MQAISEVYLNLVNVREGISYYKLYMRMLCMQAIYDANLNMVRVQEGV